jgi:tetratricopeptide (TPR) repeat protein
VDRRNLLIFSSLLAIIVVGGGAAGLIWRHQERTAIALDGVATLPDLSRWPPELQQQIARQSSAVSEARSPLEPLATLAALYWANGFARQAEQALTTLRQLDPQSARWPYLLADLHLRAGDQTGAELALQATVERDGNYAPAWLRLGELLMKRGAFDRARTVFARAVAVAPKNVWAEYNSIVVDAQHGDGDAARQRLMELVRVHPDIKELHELLADLLTAAHKPDEAVQERRRAAASELSMKTADPWLDDLVQFCYDSNRLTARAIEVRREGRFEETEQLLKQVVHLAPLAPANPLVWDLLSNFYLKMERPADARATLETAMEEFPNEPQMPLLLTRLLVTLHQPEAAIGVIQRAVQRWPEQGELHAAYGLALQDAGNFTAAVAALHKAIRLDPTLTDAQYHLGTCLLELGQRDAAHAAMEQTLAMRPDHPQALYALAAIDLEAGNLAAAEPNVLKVYANDPDEPDAQRLLAAWHLGKGLVAAQRGDLDEADRQYRAGLAVAPDFALLLREMGLIAERNGHWSEAVERFEHYIRIKPADPQGYLSLGLALRENGQPEEAVAIFQRGLSAAQQTDDKASIAEFTRLLRR